MLTQLLETKRATQRTTGGTMVSVVLHVLLVVFAIQVTQHTAAALTKPHEVAVKVPVAPPAPKAPPMPPSHELVGRAPARLGVPVLTAPVDVPIDIPPVDLGARPTDASEWVGAPGPAGTPSLRLSA
jgi:periplasmic protein TonB